MRAGDEYRQNMVGKRGLVVDRDPSKMRVKVRFDDEDETDTMWLDGLALSAGSVKSYALPNDGDEVWCLVDAKGEDGCILGAKYNDRDTPPSNDNAHLTLTGPFGTIHIDGSNISVDGAADVTVRAAGNLNLEAGGDIVTSQGGQLTNNGVNVGHDHKHTDVQPGSGKTGEPE